MEIEAKYTVPDTATLADLLALKGLAAYKFRAAGEKQLTDHYLDTASRDVLQGGYACRMREGEMDGGWLITVKGLGGAEGEIHRREEYEVEVPPNAPPEVWPESQARELALRLSGGQPLIELFAIHQQRTVREVKLGRRRVGLASLDAVEIEAGERKAVFHELEIELAPTGKLEDLQALGTLLAPYKLEPQPHSKFERALALLDQPAEPKPAKKKKHPGVRADEPMAEAGRKILRFHFERMLANEAGTREGNDIEALHDMRVATRRQRAAFRFVAPFYKRKAIRPFRDELQTLAGGLGAVRDLDVLIDSARSYQVGLEGTIATAFQPLLDEWDSKREAARDEMLAYLDSDTYRNFKDAYGKFLETAGAGARSAATAEPQLVQHILPAELWSHYSAVRAYEAVLPWASIETLHALRIEGKRLRYLLEFFSEVLGSGVEEAIKAMVALQDHLGELHDTDVTLGLLREFLMRNAQSLPPETIEAVGCYLKVKEARLRTLQRTVKRPWAKVNGKRFRRLLAKAVAGI
jgi:CHAD domain-containing protein